MQVSVTEAKGQLTELVRRAEAGDEVILTRHGHAAVRLVPVKAAPDRRIPPGAARGGSRIRLGESRGRARVLRAARISSMAMTACPDDRGRYARRLMAILLDEPEAEPCSTALEAEDELLISAGTVAEALIVAGRRNVGLEMARLIDGLGFEVRQRDAGLGTADRAGLCELGQGRPSRSTEFRRLLRLRGGEGARLPAALCGPGLRADRCRARALRRCCAETQEALAEGMSPCLQSRDTATGSLARDRERVEPTTVVQSTGAMRSQWRDARRRWVR